LFNISSVGAGLNGNKGRDQKGITILTRSSLGSISLRRPKERLVVQNRLHDSHNFMPAIFRYGPPEASVASRFDSISQGHA